jgi:hypothetical protein
MKGLKRNNAVGVKGRSGRKTLQEELAKKYAIEKAWNKINNEIDNKPVEKVALPIALKTMTDKSENTILMPSPLLDSLFKPNVRDNNSHKEDSETNEED